jgi:hypothetical protein
MQAITFASGNNDVPTCEGLEFGEIDVIRGFFGCGFGGQTHQLF